MSDLLLCLSDYPHDLVTSWLEGRDVEVVVAARNSTAGDLHPLLDRADVVIADASRRLRLDADAVARLRRCRLVIVPAVGVEGSLDVTASQARGLTVVNAPGYNAEAVADWTVWAMLEALRRPADLRDTGWVSPGLGRELGAVTVGLVGHGAIGTAVERRLVAFGTHVLHTTSREPGTADPGWVPLEELFRSSDVVSLHAPLTPVTRGLVHAGLLRAMRDDALLVNAARGGLVVETDLVAALEAGRPAYAVLDVFDEEPLPPDSPLRRLPNVRLTPHLAASTQEARRRVRAIVAAHVRAAF